MTPDDLLGLFSITETDLAEVAGAGVVLDEHLDRIVERWYGWLRSQPGAMRHFTSDEQLDRVRRQQIQHWRVFLRGRVDALYLRQRQHIGQVHASIDLPNDIYFAGVSQFLAFITECLHELRPNEMAANVRWTTAIAKLMLLDTYVVIDTIATIARDKIALHAKAVMEMSTPVTPIWDSILLLPLVGIIDSTRTADVMTKSLTKIAETRARVFVLDISGVASVDTGVANQLIKITRATQFMGCEAIISGVSPSIARTMVELGVSIGDIQTTATMRDAFEMALKRIGKPL
ncbi:protoglobin domain-containing protein [Roseateles sp.]|uniref:protoglobin domain-containing protein n=1 Tax=Roseateles sp. TaxID=1971397 RepID=UPI0025D8BD52|nr:protoglobin domain-containing protein [Roseateles sp.]MBV8037366.1 STAS domain-containing protein [Roseateles sp.]